MSNFKKALMEKNMRNLKVLTLCLNQSKKSYDIAYYLGRIESLEHVQQELEQSHGV